MIFAPISILSGALGLLKKLPTWVWIVLGALLLGYLLRLDGYRDGHRDASARYEERLQALNSDYLSAVIANTEDSARREQEVLAKLSTNKQRSEHAIASLRDHLEQQKEHHDASLALARSISESAPGTCPAHPAPVLAAVHLDAVTLRLLNQARANRSEEGGSASAGADEESRATAVTGADLALNDLRVVRMYHDLAARHDGLVDWVTAQCLSPDQNTNPTPYAPDEPDRQGP